MISGNVKVNENYLHLHFVHSVTQYTPRTVLRTSSAASHKNRRSSSEYSWHPYATIVEIIIICSNCGRWMSISKLKY